MDTILTLVNKGNDFLWSFLLLFQLIFINYTKILKILRFATRFPPFH